MAELAQPPDTAPEDEETCGRLVLRRILRPPADLTLGLLLPQIALGWAATAALAAVARYPNSPALLALFFATSGVLFPLARYNLKDQILPDAITIPGVFIGIAANIGIGSLSGSDGAAHGAVNAAAGAFVALAAWSTVDRIGSALFRVEAVLGGGDFKTAAMIGSFLGPFLALSALLNFLLGWVALAVLGCLARRGGYVPSGYLYVAGVLMAAFLFRALEPSLVAGLPAWVR